jgi:hypothetical protein
MVRVIDPRGRGPDGAPSLFGDPAYDLAKLHHSAVGFYDLIISGLFSLSERADHALTFTLEASAKHLAVRDRFRTWLRAHENQDPAVLQAISVLLFLSMLPSTPIVLIGNGPSWPTPCVCTWRALHHDRHSYGRGKPPLPGGGLHAAQVHAPLARTHGL